MFSEEYFYFVGPFTYVAVVEFLQYFPNLLKIPIIQKRFKIVFVNLNLKIGTPIEVKVLNCVIDISAQFEKFKFAIRKVLNRKYYLLIPGML